MSKQYIAYYRVSTQKQGQSGLGLAAQRTTVENYIKSGGYTLTDEYTEIETGKGADALDRRPQLKAAIDACKKQRAALIIAKLDRLARNVHFVSGLIETGIDFVAADMPQANKTMLQIHAVMSEWERDQISARTRAALAAAKARGVRLGTAGAKNLKPNIEERQQIANEFAARLKNIIVDMQARGLSLRKICIELNDLGIKSARGCDWSLTKLQRVIARF
jgi:DNA invertase Pin-like site-specific DNA recombinase